MAHPCLSFTSQSLFRQEVALFFFSHCSFVGLFLFNLLIQREARLTSLGTAGSCWCLATEGACRSSVFTKFVVTLGFWRKNCKNPPETWVGTLCPRPSPKYTAAKLISLRWLEEIKGFFFINVLTTHVSLIIRQV